MDLSSTLLPYLILELVKSSNVKFAQILINFILKKLILVKVHSEKSDQVLDNLFQWKKCFVKEVFVQSTQISNQENLLTLCHKVWLCALPTPITLLLKSLDHQLVPKSEKELLQRATQLPSLIKSGKNNLTQRKRLRLSS